jgi:hypothetical protein
MAGAVEPELRQSEAAVFDALSPPPWRVTNTTNLTGDKSIVS